MTKKIGRYPGAVEAFEDWNAAVAAPVMRYNPRAAKERWVAMAKIVYQIVQHDGGWAYKVDGSFSESYRNHEDAVAAAKRAAAEQERNTRTRRASGMWSSIPAPTALPPRSRTTRTSEDGTRRRHPHAGICCPQLPAANGAWRGFLLCSHMFGSHADMSMKRNVFRVILGRVQAMGALSLVMVWLGVLRTLTQDIPKNFP
jgi:uncharacterized protein DUF2188